MFNFHYPERGRKPLCLCALSPKRKAGSISITPKGDGNLSYFRNLTLLKRGSISITPKGDGNAALGTAKPWRAKPVQFPLPRKGTETDPTGGQRQSATCSISITPKGDGNFRSMNTLLGGGPVQFPLPRKGTETFRAERELVA